MSQHSSLPEFEALASCAPDPVGYMGPSWTEMLVGFAAHAVCWAVLGLSVWPLMPPSVQADVERGVASIVATVQEQDLSGLEFLLQRETAAQGSRPDQRGCAPVCLQVGR